MCDDCAMVLVIVFGIVHVNAFGNGVGSSIDSSCDEIAEMLVGNVVGSDVVKRLCENVSKQFRLMT